MVPPTSGMVIIPRRAASTALRTASETSLALPVAKPTRPWPSPTATRALKEKRRPPFTTFATRLIATTFSTRSLPSRWSPPRPRWSDPGRPRPPRSPPSPPRGPPRPPGLFPPRPPRPPRAPPGAPPVDGFVMSELQSALAGGVGHRLHAAVVPVSGPVEHHMGDPRALRALRHCLAYLRGTLRLRPLELRVGHREQRTTGGVVHQLRAHVLQRAEHHQAGAFLRAGYLAPHANVPAKSLLGAAHYPTNLCRHYLPPALPALRRICSP